MPIENERKYVLRDPAEIMGSSQWGFAHPQALTCRSWTPIQQGYLPGDARIRRKHGGEAYREMGDDLFTYKIDTRHGLIEIETAISEEDFDRLWEIADRKISKKRLSLVSPEGDHWDIDVFLDDNGTPYFAMAECEMPEGQDAPKWIPGAIVPLIIYEVPRERVLEFTNTRLTPEYCATLVLEPQ